jgi:hypothetical protein
MVEGERIPRMAGVAIMVYLALALGILAGMLQKTGGTFVYALDDPYIHLAMAEQLVQGHYGINASEPSSPSSSMIWPVPAGMSMSRWRGT